MRARYTEAEVAVRAALVYVLVFACLGLLIWAAPRIELPLVPQTRAGSTRISVWIIMAALVTCLVYFAFQVYRLVDVSLNGERGRAMVPFTILIGTLTVLITMLSLSSLDLMLHDFMPQWTFYMDPEYRILQNVFLLGLPLSVAWLGWIAFRPGRD